MDWFPILAGTFKVLALGTGMFFAIKWHYDQGKKESEKTKERRVVMRAAGMGTAIFLLLVLVLVFATLALGTKLGLNLTFP